MEIKKKIFIIQNLIRSENFSLAVTNSKKLIKKYPNNSFIYNLCGLALQADKKILESIEYFTKAIYYESENLAAMNNLANSYKALSKLNEAEDLYLRVIEKDPKNVKTLNNYGNLKQRFNDFNSAIDLYQRALKRDNNNINILFSLASTYQGIGKFDEAKKAINQILELDPNNTASHKLLSGFINYKDNREHLDVMENLLKKDHLDTSKKIDLHFALGKAYEDMKDYNSSFKNLEVANKLKKEKVNYQILDDEKTFDSIIKTFKDIDLEGFKKLQSDKEIIFICGMPRSGTTLVEQIIAAHKDVNGAGELIYLQSIIQKNFLEEKNLNKQKIIDQAYSNQNQVQKEYFEFLNSHKFSGKKITDKAPQNFRWIGFMKIFFPNCKIIHCSRDPKDNCLSLFKNNFASNSMDWSYNQNDIGKYYKLYLKLIGFWKQKLPSFIYEAKYENIVKNSEEEIKNLIKFCNLEWDPDCLNFHKKVKTPIQTVSVAQARKPIYKTSVNSNSGFTSYLSELYNILDTE
jgi:tetratricopeptide (TPR) repeat protein